MPASQIVWISSFESLAVRMSSCCILRPELEIDTLVGPAVRHSALPRERFSPLAHGGHLPCKRDGRPSAFAAYCGLIPAALMIRFHLSISVPSRALSAAGVARSSSTGVMLSSAKRLTGVGALSAFCKASTSASTIGFGVSRGAYRPYQVVTSKAGTPASAEVGRVGKVGTRFLVVIA